MATIEDLKEMQAPETPLFLVDCTLPSGDVFHWSTHKVTVGGQAYSARILKHNLFELRSSSTEATDGISKISLTLGNADSLLSPIERSAGWKGAQVTIQFLFFDFLNKAPASDSHVVFRGTANPPDESTESYLRLSFTNRLSLQRVYLPDVRIQKRCPWTFPSTTDQLTEALDGGAKGQYSPFYRCGYSAGLTNGVGTLNGSTPFNGCDYTRTQCQQRGMFDKDAAGNTTRRFGGIEFVPASILVRSYGEKGSHVSYTLDNQARYNDFVPLVYGTGWYTPPIVFARNDGNLTHMEVLLGSGPLTTVLKVIVNGVEIPEGVSGANMTATGWYNVVTLGTRSGTFNPDFVDNNKQPLGDPYGSMGCLSVVVPNIISNGQSLPQINVLVQGLTLERFDTTGTLIDRAFTNNPAWVLLDVLRRSGWTLADLDLPSFGAIAQRCDAPVSALDLNGNPTLIPRFQCNLIISSRRSAADIVRGIRTSAGLYLRFGRTGLLQVTAEDTLAVQQPTKPAGSNSTEALHDGWPAYEFGDNSFSGILRNSNGSASLRTSARSTADTANLFTVEFQDEFNEYQQDSLTLVDLDDSLRAGQQIATSLTALGIPNFDQATRVASLQLNKSTNGNLFVDFLTSVKAVDLKPGDIITLSYQREGWDRQPFRITRIAPGQSYRTAAITAQLHDDEWYTASGQGSTGAGRQAGAEVGLPRPLLGTVVAPDGTSQFGVTESSTAATDGTVSEQVAVSFVQPAKTTSASLGLPLVGLNPHISTTGGTLTGGQILYYGVTAVDASGAESALSFLVKASIPAGTNTNSVTLPSLSFSAAATAFNVYRGVTPSQLLQIANNQPIAAQFADPGAAAGTVGPPDPNYDHANFYWRLEIQPEETVDIHSNLTIGNSTLHMLVNEYSGFTVRITKGTGAGQERPILGNSATTVSIGIQWDIQPDATSSFAVSDSSWQFGATGVTSPVTFEIPNRAGIFIQISGRAANVRNDESSYGLSPLTRYRILGEGGSGVDTDVSPAPTFAASPAGQGIVEIQSISFPTFTNVRTISAGTLTMGFWDELTSPATLTLGADLDASSGAVTFSQAVSVQPGDLIQVESELMVVTQQVTASSTVQVSRGGYQSAAAAHTNGTLVYPLEKKIFVMPFAPDFFGSPASGSYSYPAYLPDVRVATIELFMTNSQGTSDVTRRSFTATLDGGMRTYSGGQLTIQIQGPLAIQTNAAPPLLMEDTHSIRDIYANLGTAPGATVQLQVTENGQPYCQINVAAGSTSGYLGGFGLPPLSDKALIGLDILSVSQTSDTPTGSDLTVTVRL